MTRSGQWLVFSSVLSVGAGFLGGTMLARRAAARDRLPSTLGRLYEVDTETYIDGDLAAFLTARADSSDLLRGGKWDGWTVLRYRAVVLLIKQLHDGQVFAGQGGGLYIVRGEKSVAREDQEVQRFLQEMIDLGLVVYGGRWREWGEVLRLPNDARRH